jgi:hypothetical protein
VIFCGASSKGWGGHVRDACPPAQILPDAHATNFVPLRCVLVFNTSTREAMPWTLP